MYKGTLKYYGEVNRIIIPVGGKEGCFFQGVISGQAVVLVCTRFYHEGGPKMTESRIKYWHGRNSPNDANERQRKKLQYSKYVSVTEHSLC